MQMSESGSGLSATKATGPQPMLRFLAGYRARLLLSLYVSQYIGMGFVFAAIPAIARSKGLSLDDIAIFYSLAMIWTLKVLWAPLMDRYQPFGGPAYRGWLIGAQLCLAAATLACSFFDPVDHLGAVAACVAAMCFTSSVQDVAADAVAVRLLPPEDRGIGNAVQTAGGLIGALVGAGGAVLAYEQVGWQATLWGLAALTLLPSILILQMRSGQQQEETPAEKVTYGLIWQFLLRPGTPRWLAVLVVAEFGLGAQIALVNPMLVDHGWNLTKIALGTALWGALFGVSGAGMAAVLFQRFTRRAALIGALLLSAALSVPIAFYHAAAMADWQMVVVLALYYTGWGMTTTALATVMMDHCRARSAGSDYSSQFSIGALIGLMGSSLALSMAETYGYTAALAAGACSCLLAAILAKGKGAVKAP